MIRCYKLTEKAYPLIDNLVTHLGRNMSEVDLYLAEELCQVQIDSGSDEILVYNTEIPNTIPAFGIMRLEERKLIERDEAMELIYTLPLIGEYVEWERPREY